MNIFIVIACLQSLKKYVLLPLLEIPNSPQDRCDHGNCILSTEATIWWTTWGSSEYTSAKSFSLVLRLRSFFLHCSLLLLVSEYQTTEHCLLPRVYLWSFLVRRRNTVDLAANNLQNFGNTQFGKNAKLYVCLWIWYVVWDHSRDFITKENSQWYSWSLLSCKRISTCCFEDLSGGTLNAAGNLFHLLFCHCQPYKYNMR